MQLFSTFCNPPLLNLERLGTMDAAFFYIALLRRLYSLLTPEFFEHTVLPTLGIILSLEDLERGHGKSGQFNV